MNKEIKKLKGGNMHIDLTSDKSDIDWEQAICPWNKEEILKNISVQSKIYQYVNIFVVLNIWILFFVVTLMIIL